MPAHAQHATTRKCRPHISLTLCSCPLPRPAEIWPPAAERSESPLPFSSVFAEERIAIFRIEKGGQSDEAARALRGNVQDAVPPGGPTSVE